MFTDVTALPRDQRSVLGNAAASSVKSPLLVVISLATSVELLLLQGNGKMPSPPIPQLFKCYSVNQYYAAFMFSPLDSCWICLYGKATLEVTWPLVASVNTDGTLNKTRMLLEIIWLIWTRREGIFGNCFFSPWANKSLAYLIICKGTHMLFCKNVFSQSNSHL